MRLTTTRQDILSILAGRSQEEFYVNELIRLTSRLPNSVEKALEILVKDDLIKERKFNHRKFFRIRPSFIPEVKEQISKTIGFDWIKLLNRETAYAFNFYVCKANIDLLPEIYGIDVPTFWYNGVTGGVYYLKHELADLGNTISEKLGKDTDFARRDTALCRKNCDKLVSFSKRIFGTDLQNLSDRELAKFTANFAKIYEKVFPFLVTPHAIERYFESHIREAISKEAVLNILLSPVKTEDAERESALRLAARVKRHGFDSSSEKLLTAHWQNFCWLSLWSLNAKSLTREYFRGEIENILEKISDPDKELRRLAAEVSRRKKLFGKTLKKVRAGRELSDHILLLQEYIFLRTYRKNAICQAHYYHLPLLDKVAKRLKLTNESVKLLSYEELVGGLLGEVAVKKLQGLVHNRKPGWAVLMWQGKVTTVTGIRKIVETVEQFGIVSPNHSARTIKGNPASRGKVIGPVKVIHNLSQLDKVQKGDILVAKMTTPDYIMAINRCAGIITDEGGVTCHAAIVSREFNIPCLVATHSATRLLKDNDLVELDASAGLVRIIEKKNPDMNVKEIKGRPVFPGKKRGRAVIVLDAADFSKVQTGDILITSQPTPDFLSSLYRVAALVIDEDSLTSHGVLYAQSLRLPCIMGTGNVREIINDGEIIEVDAVRGTLRRIAEGA